MSTERATELIELFNDGEYEDEIKPYFNSLINFFKFVKKYNRLDEIDLSQISRDDFTEDTFNFVSENNMLTKLDYDDVPEELRNVFLLSELNNNYEKTVIYITNNLITDVEIRPDGFYLKLRDREELADLFCEGGRNDYGPIGVAKRIFSEEGLGHEWFYDSGKKPSDTIDELDEANIIRLKDAIFKEIGNVELSVEDYNSDFFSELSEEQGTEGYFTIKAEDLNELLKNEDAINELCTSTLGEIGQELTNIYYNAENVAYEDEIYTLVYNGLDEYFEGGILQSAKEITRYDGSKVTKYFDHIKIRDFIGNIKTFLYQNKFDTYNESFLEYFGTYVSMMNQLMIDNEYRCIDFRTPDYPDGDLTSKHINDMFSDYI
jgi:hypothetical protein